MFQKEKVDPIGDLRKGVEEVEQSLEHEHENLQKLFISLKTDIFQSLLSGETGLVNQDRLNILQQQLDHVIQIARSIHSPELLESFEKEQRIIGSLSSLVKEFPDADIASRPDIRNMLTELQSLMENEQSLIFHRHDVLAKEKLQLIDILKQVQDLNSEERSIFKAKANNVNYS